MNKTKKIISKIISILLVVFIAVPFFPMSANAIGYSVTFTGGHGVFQELNYTANAFFTDDAVLYPTPLLEGKPIPDNYDVEYSFDRLSDPAETIGDQPPTAKGWYRLNVKIKDGGNTIAEGYTDYLITDRIRYSALFYLNGREVASSNVYWGNKITDVPDYTKDKEGYRFDGWYSDEACTTPFDLNQTIAPESLGSFNSAHFVELYAKMTKLTKVDEVAPTCTEDGTAEYWKDAEGNIFADAYGQEELDMPGVIEATGHKWGDPVYTWSDDESEVTASRKCKNDASHVETETVKTEIVVVKEPTDTEDGILQVIATFKNSAFEKQVREYGFNKNAEDEYALISELTEWIKGGKDPLSLRFKNLTDDEGTFDQFLGIKVDDELVSEDNYTKEKGSVIVNLKPEYLEKLSVGEHTIEAMFIYGSVKAKFTIKEAKATEVKAAEAKKEAAKSNATKTGDSSPLLIAIIVMAVSALAIVTMIVVKKKKKN